MRKTLFSTVYFTALLLSALSFHQAFAQRSPSVEPLSEIAIEEDRPTPVNGEVKGYDFNTPHASKKVSTRSIAPMVSKKSEHRSAASYLGPLIFLFALPVALWIVVAKKMAQVESPDHKGYYPKTYQLKNYRAGIQDQDELDEDQDYPKAS